MNSSFLQKSIVTDRDIPETTLLLGCPEYTGMKIQAFPLDREANIKAKKFLPNSWKYNNFIPRYKFNDIGIRSNLNEKDIDWKNSYVIVGCSHIFGQGVSENETISEFLNTEYGIKCINAGTPGASNYSINANAIHIRKKYNPKGIIIFWTYPNRFTWVVGHDEKAWDSLDGNTHMDITEANFAIKNFGIPKSHVDIYKQAHKMFDFKLAVQTQTMLGSIQYNITDCWSSNIHNEKNTTPWKIIREDMIKDYSLLHDISFGGEFDKTNSKHMNILNNYYAMDLVMEKGKPLLRHFGRRINQDIAAMIYLDNFK